ncbi:hypothetical protein [Pseudoduganella sp.]|uniref:hypothetical protein n=1 Tax=Pseudoduganella sp. TaxID=1880898 RepID=UPI0035B09912
MKKLCAVFLFAAGVGASLSASARDWQCEYICRVDRDHCLQQAGDDWDARQACQDWWEGCWVRCGNQIP